MIFEFKPWRRFKAFRDQKASQNFLQDVARETVARFRHGIASPKSGRVYRRRGRLHKASAPGEYPARDSGGLIGTLRGEVNRNRAVVGTNKFYSKFLRDGTTKMAPRRMSGDAMREAIPTARARMKRWVVWKQG